MTGGPGAPAEGWVECRCGARHWGRHGAAGVLLTDGASVVLQHRAAWSHHGGTWALPGGALHADESAVAGALREAGEEAGIAAGDVEVVATTVLAHPDWSYTTVIARAVHDLDVRATDAESVAVTWVGIDEVADRELLPAFGDAWPTLRRMLAVDLHVVIDAANVVGSRPDGWWRDRRGATERLLAAVAATAPDGVDAELVGLPGRRWWPRWHAVVEGAARGSTAPEGIEVREAVGSGDDAVVARTRELVDGGGTVVVVTADRELRARVTDAGGSAIGPGALRSVLDV